MQKPIKSTARVRVVIADDNRKVREAVVELLSPFYEIVGTATDGSAACELVTLLTPDIVVLDISMPILSGIEVAAELKKKGLEAKAVFLTVHDDPDFVRAALTSGASGYVVKSHMANDLPAAIRIAIEGNFFISPCCALSDDSGHQKTG